MTHPVWTGLMETGTRTPAECAWVPCVIAAAGITVMPALTADRLSLRGASHMCGGASRRLTDCIPPEYGPAGPTTSQKGG